MKKSYALFAAALLAGSMMNVSLAEEVGVKSGEGMEGRTFVDFKIEFRDNPYTVILPANGELPTGVSVEGTNYNGGQHGVSGGLITVPVDGPVKFTIGACQYSSNNIIVKKDGESFTTISNKAACGETAGNFAQNITYVYNGDAATLSFELIGQTLMPYFFAEATVYEPANLGSKTIAEFLELKNTVDTCMLTGVVTSISNTTYGNFYLADETDSVFVYGVLTPDGKSRQFGTLGVDEGDTLTIKAIYSEYQSTPQIQNAIFVSVKDRMVSGLDNIPADSKSDKPVKLYRDGMLLIEKNGKTYNEKGQMMK